MAANGPGPTSHARAARFEAIFRSFYPRVLAYALRRCDDRASAEEATAETFLVAWRRLDVVPLEALPWLLGVARKVLANERRRASRRPPDGPSVPLELVAVADAQQPIPEVVADRTAFAAAFAGLSENDREALALIAWEGLQPREAAAVVGCSTAVFSVRLHRARRRLLKELQANGHSWGERGAQPVRRPRPDASEAR
ncbi:MAG: sigma-70 family RNA polymerase sigma factor [Actinobacteria bacterium]|nr:sigma-70 family RNA polymerase sigma factor [Actinomycetota bacterium]